MSEGRRPDGRRPDPARGLLALDQPEAEILDLLRAAKVPIAAGRATAFRQLVLGTPGLERTIGGLIVDAESLHSVTGVPPILGERRVPIGVRMGEGTVRGLDVATDAPTLVAEISAHAAAGASFARWRLVAGRDATASELRPAAALVGRWAAHCQANGLGPFVDCVVPVGPHARLTDAAAALTTTVGTVLDALDAAGADPAGVLLGCGPVTPGRRTGEPATSDDVAQATLAALRAAGADDVGGVAFRPAGDAAALSAHLAAIGWLSPEWPVGYCVGRSVLTAVARVWRGRDAHVAAAQTELQQRLTRTDAVLRSRFRETGPLARRAG